MNLLSKLARSCIGVGRYTCVASILFLSARASDELDFNPIFDGKTLSGWRAFDSSYWSVEDGAITARISREHPCSLNQYLLWTGGEVADFELKLQSRVNGQGGTNSGFQFRSRLMPDHDICGYQVDNNLQTPWLVRLYDEYGRHTLAMRGERAQFNTDGSRVVSRIDDVVGPAWFALEGWHTYHLTCRGSKVTLKVDGRIAAEVDDQDLRRQDIQGVLALQLHGGPPAWIQFRDIQIRVIRGPEEAPRRTVNARDQKRVDTVNQALAWWPLDLGGHGAKPALRHIPMWERFELNVRASGPGARPESKIVILDGAYFEADAGSLLTGREITVLLRARDPRGHWNAAMFGDREVEALGQFSLSCGASDEPTGKSISFAIQTERGVATARFPLSRIDQLAWHDFVGRYDGKSVSLFCDGNLMSQIPHSGILVQSKGQLRIGADVEKGKPVRQFLGELETAAIWGEALADSQIQSLSGSSK